MALTVLEAKAAEYRQKRKLQGLELGRATVTVSKTGKIIDDDIIGGQDVPRPANQMLVDVTADNRQVYYQGYQVGLPTTFAGRQFHRTVTEHEFLLSDPDTSEIVFSFPLPLIALKMRGRWVASYAIRGVQLTHPTKQWTRKAAAYREQFSQREEQVPEVFKPGSAQALRGS
ncbi:hypothetical protein [Arthrobacter sp.]|uniref:hypothetical protein n=1 Tax=Arthrobacter sp. TaxID=1667 RepID=UPI003A8DD466